MANQRTMIEKKMEENRYNLQADLNSQELCQKVNNLVSFHTSLSSS
jgi:hypothetical protein